MMMIIIVIMTLYLVGLEWCVLRDWITNFDQGKGRGLNSDGELSQSFLPARH